MDYNLNTTYYKTLDENFNRALELYATELPHQELINLLVDGNIVQKQIAALKLDNINTQQEAEILMSNLVGQDGKIREAVSFRLQEFLKDKALHKLFINNAFSDIFLAAIVDINGNICRNIIAAISYLKDYPEGKEKGRLSRVPDRFSGDSSGKKDGGGPESQRFHLRPGKGACVYGALPG